jgi:hypothetical protein
MAAWTASFSGASAHRDADGPLRLRADDSIPARSFIAAHVSELQVALSRIGCVLLRGFSVDDLADFRLAVAQLCTSLIDDYGDLPPSTVTGAYEATPYDNRLDIQFHNEASHTPTAPSRQFFFCEQAAAEGGQWRVVDGRRVAARLPSDLVDRFARNGLRYSRRFIPHVDVSWQRFLKTTDEHEATTIATALGYDARWDTGTRILTLTRRAPALLHDGTVWFNQIMLHHRLALPERSRAALTRAFGDGPFPREVSFGDGSVIDEETLVQVRQALEDEAVDIETHSGDILLINNILVAHSRAPYRGDRRVRVVLGDPVAVDTLI